MDSPFRREVMDAIKNLSFKMTKLNLPIYGVPEITGDHYSTKKNVSKDRKNVTPADEYRIEKEDIYVDDPNAVSNQPADRE